MIKLIVSLFLLLVSNMAFGGQLPSPFIGFVDRIFDGDTIAVYGIDKNDRYKISLLGIDAPEKRQKGGMESKRFLKKIAALQSVEIHPYEYNEKHEIIASVIMKDGSNLSELSVQNGQSWWNRKDPTNIILENAENTARLIRCGIWEKENPMPPWEWRYKQPFSIARKLLKEKGIVPGQPFPAFNIENTGEIQ